MIFRNDSVAFWVAVGLAAGGWLAFLWALGLPGAPPTPAGPWDETAARAWQFQITCGTGEQAILLAHTLPRVVPGPAGAGLAEGDLESEDIADPVDGRWEAGPRPRLYELYTVEGGTVVVGQTDATQTPIGAAVVVENLGPQGVYLNTAAADDTAVGLLAPGDSVELGGDILSWAASLRCPDPEGATVKVTALPSE